MNSGELLPVLVDTILPQACQETSGAPVGPCGSLCLAAHTDPYGAPRGKQVASEVHVPAFTVNVGQARCWATPAQDLAVSSFFHWAWLPLTVSPGLDCKRGAPEVPGPFPTGGSCVGSSAGHGCSATDAWPRERQERLLMWDWCWAPGQTFPRCEAHGCACLLPLQKPPAHMGSEFLEVACPH